MAFDEGKEDSTPFPFNYCVDNELLTIVLTTEVYLIPFHKTRAAFGAIREQMISSGGFCAITSHHHAPSATDIPATATQLLERYRHLITNHPSRDVPATKHPFHEMQLNKRSRLLNQIFSKIINAIYPRSVGRPPRKYAFNDFLDIMLLEQVLQKNVHLLSRNEAIPQLSAIRQYMIAQCDFPDVPPTPAPSAPAKGPPTVPQLTVRYQQLINNHVNATGPEEIDVDRDPEVERKLHHLLDVITQSIGNGYMEGIDLHEKEPEPTSPVARKGRRGHVLEERRLALEEDIQKQNRKRLAIEEERQKIDMQRLKIQEDMFQLVQKEHKAILSVLTGITGVLSRISENFEDSNLKKETNFLKQDADASDIAGFKEATNTGSDADKMLDIHDASQSEKVQATATGAEGGNPKEDDGTQKASGDQKDDGTQKASGDQKDDGTQKASGDQKDDGVQIAEEIEIVGGAQEVGSVQEVGSAERIYSVQDDRKA
ncbi:hypothetical protein BWQ96_06163 [Gracilariopsis chorda]|uniref:Uncharacterized protein n=1 Tax=Gracilariopsis chorda TaxID=448386 RepID=A0A2V3IPT2_9FLOR|nr:hypothetical protein BWQ96_06163 [Gracilariopsis chorda]|eukprot:PXF44082.1 hypothetical protein BWQ96_06163 [Gracilariopsis chorda]